MSNANHSWDGKQLTGTVSGFSEYSTGVSDSAVKTEVLTPTLLLNKIKEMQHFLTLPDLDHALKVIYDHIQKKGNPHRTSLNEFVNSIIDVLYTEYVKNGGDKTLAQYTHNLFKVLHVASVDELEKGTDSTALVSIAGIRNIIHAHEIDPNAHQELIEKMFPGSPLNTDPVLSLIPAMHIPKAYMIKTDSSDTKYPYTYVGKDRYIHVAKYGVLPTDYAYREPMVACFGERTNEITDCCNFDNRITYHITATDHTTDPMNTLFATQIRSKASSAEIDHGFALKKIELEKNKSKTFSLYARAGTCKYLIIQFYDLTYKMNINAIFDIKDGSFIIQNHHDHYRADMVNIGHGWYRCEFTLLSKLEQESTLTVLLFKEKDPKVQNFRFLGEEGEHLADLFGMQLEDGPSASPFIFSKTTPATRHPVYLKATIDTSEWIDKSFTLNVGLRRIASDPYITDRPICTVYNENDLVSEIVWRSNSMVEVDHWCKLTMQDTTITTLIDQIMFDKQTNKYGQITVSIDSKNMRCAYNKVTEDRVTPENYSIGNIILVGTDTVNYFEGYINKVIVYPCGCNTKQLVYLNGDEIDGD